MGQGSRSQKGLGLAGPLAIALAVAATGVSATAVADPVIRLPPTGKGQLAGGKDSAFTLSLVAEMNALGILGAERLTTFPDVAAIEGAEPELGTMRVGLVGKGNDVPLSFSFRLDLSEGLRVDGEDFDDDTTATLVRFVDDAYVWWHPTELLGVIAGRQKVPFSRFRHIERVFQTAVAVPFLIDRVAPDRRWGVSALGDLGSISYAFGGFTDNDQTEVRMAEVDPSEGGRAIAAAHAEWTPFAPIGGDYVATPTSDPWWDWVRASIGMGILYRYRDNDIGDRLDLSMSANLKYRRYSAMTELILASAGQQVALSAAGELSILVTERLTLFGRSDSDIEIDTWSLGGGAGWYVTKDRRNKVSFYGWARRRDGERIKRDGVVVQLQASL
jgi:hypothetical protein